MVVLITGASSGLGKYTAEEFAGKGHIVYGTSRSAARTAEGINMISLDVCDGRSCREAVNYVMENEGRIDLLINNAGIGIAGSAEFTSDQEAKLQFETNFFGVLRMCREVLPYMRSQKSGRIINVSSVAAAVPIPFQSMYSAGKAAVESLSQAMNMEAAPYNIDVISIEFGDMKTGFTGSRIVTRDSEKDEKNIYKDMFERSLKTMERDEQNGPEPLGAARLIYRTSVKKSPKPVIVCGSKYRAIVILRRILPLRLSNAVIKMIYAK